MADMSKEQRMLVIKSQMSKAIDKKAGDQETWHINGDNLLETALETLATGTRYESVVKQILEEYSAIPKWYA